MNRRASSKAEPLLVKLQLLSEYLQAPSHAERDGTTLGCGPGGGMSGTMTERRSRLLISLLGYAVLFGSRRASGFFRRFALAGLSRLVPIFDDASKRWTSRNSSSGRHGFVKNRSQPALSAR